jgi:hypothetical protein
MVATALQALELVLLVTAVRAAPEGGYNYLM